MSDETIEIAIRLTNEEIARYKRIARAANTDLNTVLCVMLALSVTKPQPIRLAPKPRAKKK